MNDSWVKRILEHVFLFLIAALATFGAVNIVEHIFPSVVKPPVEKLDPLNAIAKMVMSGGYCSGTTLKVGDKYYLISAAHCATSIGEQVQIVYRDERRYAGRVIHIDRQSDLCIVAIQSNQDVLPYTRLFEGTLKQNDPIWHAGFGVHVPGNREEGYVVDPTPDANQQLKFWLSVSRGDSGGGIIHTQTGHLISPVCCTTKLNSPGYVWGCSPHIIREQLDKLARVSFTALGDVEPLELPLRAVQ